MTDDGPVTLVLTRRARPGHEARFAGVLHRISEYARRFPGHRGVTIVRPTGDEPYTILAHFDDRNAADAWLADAERARLVAEAGLHADDGLRVRMLSGLEGWVSRPGQPVMVPPPRWKVALATWVGILPVLEVVFFVLVPHLAPVPPPARPVVLSAVMIPAMTYGIMPVVTRLLRRFLYPSRPGAVRPRVRGQPGGPVQRAAGSDGKVASSRPGHSGGSMLKGFRDFIMRGNVVDLAVGIVIGAAFTGLVTSFTEHLLQPIIKRIAGGNGEFAGKVGIGGGQALDWGAFITAVINFLLVAAVLYYLVVLPMNKLAERRRRGEVPPPKAPSEEIKLLTDIRDALVRGGAREAGGPAEKDVPVYPSDAPEHLDRR